MRTYITSLTRTGVIDKAGTAETFGLLDKPTIGYSGNRLSWVNPSTDALLFEGMTGLGRNASDMQVTYDDAGRMRSDETRGIETIDYDNDGHPVRIVFGSGCEQQDVWDGFGNHISTIYYKPDASGKAERVSVKSYTGEGHVMVGGEVVMSHFPGGYFSDGGAHYYVNDYQGNVIAVLSAIGMIEQRTAYYPYGEPWREPSGQSYLFSGNERLRVDGLNEYDFNARRYNPVLGSFTTWDALNEQYPWLSPYAYCAGNPICKIDPDGNEWKIFSYRDDDDKLHINMRITGVVYNVSSEKFNMTAVRQGMSSQIEDVFSLNGKGFEISMATDIREVSSLDEINDKDHVFAIVDQSYFEDGTVANSQPSGLVIALGAELINMTLDGRNNRSIAHEVGHTGGLSHPNNIKNKFYIPDRKNNLMTQTKYGKGRNLEINQFNSIIYSYNNGKLNNKKNIIQRIGFSSKWPFITINSQLNL